MSPTSDPDLAAAIETSLVSLLRTTFVGYGDHWEAARKVIEWKQFEIEGRFPFSCIVATFADVLSARRYLWRQQLWDEEALPQLSDVSAHDLFDNIVDLMREGLGSLWTDPDRHRKSPIS